MAARSLPSFTPPLESVATRPTGQVDAVAPRRGACSRTVGRLRSRGRYTLLLAPLAAFLLVAGSCSQDGDDVQTGGSRDSASLTSSEVTGGALPPTLTNQVAMAWSGTEALVVSSSLFDVATTSMQVATFDPRSGKWGPVADPSFDFPLFSPAVYWLSDRYLVVGVLCESVTSAESSSIECSPGKIAAATYSPASDSWTAVKAPETLGSAPSLIQSSNSKERAVLRDGERVHLYDLASGEWSTFTPFFESSRECIVGDQVLVAGGDFEPRVQTYSSSRGDLSETIAVDAANSTWSFACGPSAVWGFPLPAAGAAVANAVLHDGTAASSMPSPQLGSPVVRSDRLDQAMLVQSSNELLGVLDASIGVWRVIDPPGGDIKAIAMTSPREALVVILPDGGKTYDLAVVPL